MEAWLVEMEGTRNSKMQVIELKAVMLQLTGMKAQMEVLEVPQVVHLPLKESLVVDLMAQMRQVVIIKLKAKDIQQEISVN